MTAQDAGEATIDDRAALSEREQATKRAERKRSAISWGLTIALAIGLTVVVKTWFYQPYSIPSGSMIPTLEVGDRVVVSKLNTDPGRGDIIVFDRPANDPAPDADAPEVLIKRVIGLPGERVTAVDGQVYIDGKPLREDYLPDGTRTEISNPITVPDGELLVMGDNRQYSQDGRVFGPISKDLIVGRAILRIWPLDRFGKL